MKSAKDYLSFHYVACLLILFPVRYAVKDAVHSVPYPETRVNQEKIYLPFSFQCTTNVTSCDGGGGALGHPRVYINLDEGVPVSCIYCALRYVYKEGHDH